MRSAWFVVALALAACGGSEPQGDPDAPDAPPSPCDPPLQLESRCGGQLCGNGELDACWSPNMGLPHCAMNWRQETCDGPVVLSCEQLGYFGGTTACRPSCFVDETVCDPCASTGSCAEHRGVFDIVDAVPSGARTAILRRFGGGSGVTFVEDATEVAQSTLPPWGAVGVPAGWLVAHTPAYDQPMRIAAIDTNGTTTADGPVPADFEPFDSVPRDGSFAMVYGPDERVLIVMNAQDFANQPVVRYVIADASGAIVASGGELFDPGFTEFGATTDGVAFFVGSRGQLARVAPDGAVSTYGGFPLPGYDQAPRTPARLAWSTTGGWYVARTGANDYAIQRFDATGARAGASYVLTLPYAIHDIEADGADLLMLGFAPPDPPAAARLALVRVASDGTVAAMDDIGAGDDRGITQLRRRSGDVLVNWQTSWGTYLAAVTP